MTAPLLHHHSLAGSADAFATCVAAATLQMRAIDALPATVLDQFAEHVFLPGLMAPGAQFAPFHSELCALLTSLIGQHQSHNLSVRLLSTVAASLAACCEASAAAVGELTSKAAGAAPPPPPLKLSLGISGSCQLLQSLAAAAMAGAEGSAGAAATHSQRFWAQLQQQLLPVGLAMLISSHQAATAAIRYVLPAVLLASKQPGASPDHAAVCALLWRRCTALMAAPGSSRRVGLAAMVRFAPLWATSAELPGDTAATSTDASCEGLRLDPAAADAFWSVLQACLVDAEPLNRKRAVHVMQRLPKPGGSAAVGGAWEAFALLHDAFEDFGMHLVRAQWHLVGALHPAAPEHAGARAGTALLNLQLLRTCKHCSACL